jgi:DNA modification methylase
VIDVSTSSHHVGDCRELLARLPEGCVQTCVTSPPYWGLRDYGHDGQLGLEATPDLYVAAIVDVFRGARRALREDGTLWLNLGDSYASSPSGGTGVSGSTLGGSKESQTEFRKSTKHRNVPAGLKQKDLVGIPWMVAFALRADGWYLRQDIIWHKPNPMPESVTDRCTKAHEYLFLLSKSETYFMDREGLKERAVSKKPSGNGYKRGARLSMQNPDGSPRGGDEPWKPAAQRNLRSVWTVATQPYDGAHFATFPPRLIEPCILAGSRPGDIVLDPFFGSGTTGMVAQQHGRRYIGFDLGYEDLATERLRSPMLPMRGVC